MKKVKQKHIDRISDCFAKCLATKHDITCETMI